MLDTEYNEAEAMELFREEGRKEGKEEGRKEGKIEGRKEGKEEGISDTNELYAWLFSQGRAADVEKATTDKTVLNKLFEEYKNSIKK